MANINIKYFGMISSTLNKDDEYLEVIDSITLLDFRTMILKKYPQLVDIKFKMAVNQEISGDERVLKNNDEVALLPPYAGG